MATNFILLMVELWLLGGLMLFLHRLSPRCGLTPMLLGLGALVALLLATAPLNVFVRLNSDVTMTLGSEVLVPVILLGVLVIYVHEGTIPARTTILGLIGVAVFVVLVFLVIRLHLSLPGGGSLGGLTVDSPALNLNPRVAVASVAAFAADLCVVVIIYQWLASALGNRAVRLSAGIALLAGLWSDALIYRLVAYVGTPGFELFASDFFGKTLAALVLLPLVALYLSRTAAVKQRPVLDLLFSTSRSMENTLIRSETALHESEERYRQLTENISDVFWLSDLAQSRVYYVSPAYEKIWGRSCQSLYDAPGAYLEGVHPEDRPRITAARERLKAGGDFNEEYRVVQPTGTIRWVRDRAFPIRDEKGDIYRTGGIVEDITEAKQAEAQRLELTIAQERINLLHEFIGEAAHDFKTPLSIITTKVGLLRKVQDPERQQAHLEVVEAQAMRLGKMIDDLMALSRLKNSQDLTYRFLDVNAVVEALLKDHMPIAEGRGLTLTVNLDRSLPTIPVDQVELKRALSNLIENAIYYTERGGVTISTFNRDHDLVIEVRDTGIGIPESDLPRIFDRFYRADKSRATEKGGSGLGLAIVKRVVEMHGGTIRVESQVGLGTTFRIALPTVWPRPNMR